MNSAEVIAMVSRLLVLSGCMLAGISLADTEVSINSQEAYEGTGTTLLRNQPVTQGRRIKI